jgi:CheY-like chemotaxis protein
MDKETVERIFEPFYTTKDTGQGTGFGLATVYGIVKNHGGYINCYSESGHGTTFKIYLPAFYLDGEPVEKKKGDGEVVPGGRETILVVDDEEVLRGISTRMLTGKGYQILSAADAEEALVIYGEKGDAIDLVILDVSMPGMGGHQCLKEILKMNPKAKVLIASGYARNGHLGDILKSGAAGYLAKPFLKAELLSKVRKVLDGE